ncbi:hypothetical protein EJD97_020113 [Solanum chilense]|uniref:Uncharacterized protein n=1 Tax=Solanum chilense TaxID=4083 RepID=A0A6N2AYL5_SOLCI|nr:hypothetical protein EJD97_020113 [Solanum chilense]
MNYDFHHPNYVLVKIQRVNGSLLKLVIVLFLLSCCIAIILLIFDHFQQHHYFILGQLSMLNLKSLCRKSISSIKSRSYLFLVLSINNLLLHVI